MPKPHIPIVTVRQCAARPHGFRLQGPRAGPFLLQEAGSYAAGFELARRVLCSLEERQFVQTVRLHRDGDLADEYGVIINKRGWYLKLTLAEEETVIVISLHPLERPIRTRGGLVVP